MGDMKTPDFDDLLAAFDIPDIDTNEAIHSGHEEAEAHVKPLPAEPPAPDHVLPHTDITTVSVIVKNTVCPEQLDPADGRGKDGLGPRLLQNGFEAPRSPPACPAEVAPPANGECWAPKEKGKSLDLFAHFSPDPSQEGAANLIDQPRECKPKEKPLAGSPLSPPPKLAAIPPQDCPEQVGESVGPLPPPFPPPFEAHPAGGMGLPPPPPIKQEKDCEGPCRGASPSGCPQPSSASYRVGSSPLAPWPGSDAALAISSGGAPEVKRLPASPQKPSPKPEGSPGPSASPKLLGTGSLKEEPVEKPVQCPAEASSGEEGEVEEEEEDDSAGSPSSPSSRPLKVRIKTIKSSTGSITRTVTRVSTDLELAASGPRLSRGPRWGGRRPPASPREGGERGGGDPPPEGPRGRQPPEGPGGANGGQRAAGRRHQAEGHRAARLHPAERQLGHADGGQRGAAEGRGAAQQGRGQEHHQPGAAAAAQGPRGQGRRGGGRRPAGRGQPEGERRHGGGDAAPEVVARHGRHGDLPQPEQPGGGLQPDPEQQEPAARLQAQPAAPGGRQPEPAAPGLPLPGVRRRLRAGEEPGAPLRPAQHAHRGDLQPLHQAPGLLQQVQPPPARPRAQGQGPGHAVLPPGHAPHRPGPDDRAARHHPAGARGRPQQRRRQGGRRSHAHAGRRGPHRQRGRAVRAARPAPERRRRAPHHELLPVPGVQGAVQGQGWAGRPLPAGRSLHHRHGVQRLPHDDAQPLQLRRPPAHAQEPAPPRLPRVWGQLPPGQLRGPLEGGLPALLPQDRLQVPELHGRLRGRELHQVAHPDDPLRGVPQVPHLPHGVQVGPQRPRPHLHPAPRLQQPAVQDDLQVRHVRHGLHPQAPALLPLRPAPAQPAGERLQVPRLPPALRPEADHAGAPEAHAPPPEAQGGQRQEAGRGPAHPQAGAGGGGAPAARQQALGVVVVLFGRRGAAQLPGAAQEQAGPLPAQGRGARALQEQRLDLRDLPLLVPRAGRVRGAHEEGPREVREEVPLPPLRALLLLGPQPAEARPGEPRGHQAGLPLPVLHGREAHLQQPPDPGEAHPGAPRHQGDRREPEPGGAHHPDGCPELPGLQPEAQALLGRRGLLQRGAGQHHAALQDPQGRAAGPAPLPQVWLRGLLGRRLPGPHPPAQDRRERAPVPRVRALLHLPGLPQPPPLHHPQEEAGGGRRRGGQPPGRPRRGLPTAGRGQALLHGLRQGLRHPAEPEDSLPHPRHGLHQGPAERGGRELGGGASRLRIGWVHKL